jgi:folate-dependent phosphoribosylglycinamide formyltransferase PurN
MYRIGWFSTGRGPGSRSLLTAVYDSIQNGILHAEIPFVFLSREPGEFEETDKFISLVNSYQIPLIYYSYQKFKAKHEQTVSYECFPQWRLAYDREVMARIKEFVTDIVLLAGYMLIVGPEMCNVYNMINLHPAAPLGPTGTWQEVIWKLIAKKSKQSGVMMHLVTPELDRGPVVSYCTYPIRGQSLDTLWQENEKQSVDKIKRTDGENNSLFKAIRAEGLKREYPLIIATARAFSQGDVRIRNKFVVDRNCATINGYDLTLKIEEMISCKT